MFKEEVDVDHLKPVIVGDVGKMVGVESKQMLEIFLKTEGELRNSAVNGEGC